MKTENEITTQIKLVQFTLGVLIGIVLWCLTLALLFILN